jgi:hypothetical protein
MSKRPLLPSEKRTSPLAVVLERVGGHAEAHLRARPIARSPEHLVQRRPADADVGG